MQTSEGRWTSAAFRIISENLSIEDICAKINTQPTKYFAKGELYSKRNPKSRVREENLWLLESELSDQNTIESHVKHFLSFLKENEDGIKDLQVECEFDIVCAYSSENGQGGFRLDHEVLKELTAYPVDLSINLYPPERNSENWQSED